MTDLREVRGSPFYYYPSLDERLESLQQRVLEMRRIGKLSGAALERLQKFFKIKGIYHSNAIEGNSLTIGETRLVIEHGITITGKTLRDQAEAVNLSEAVDFMERLAKERERPITQHDLRQIHTLILKTIDDGNAGRYRTSEVRISGSDYIPPSPEQVPLQMDDLGRWLETIRYDDSIAAPLSIAAAAHAWLAQIHPFVDGNGRTCRLLMNLILIRFGYPICIISRDDRLRYYDALEQSQSSDLTPLIEVIYENTEESLEEWERAAEEQRQEQEWLTRAAAQLSAPAMSRARNEYELWLNAMELLRSYFEEMARAFNEHARAGAEVCFRPYGQLEFEKYLALREGESAKRTWFFSLEFRSGVRRAKYLFFFGYGSYIMRQRASVVLVIAKETAPSFFEPLSRLSLTEVPSMHQIGYDAAAETFVAEVAGRLEHGKMQELGQRFIQQVIQKDFG